jgi:SAM-dependent methyltransferase
MIVGCLNTEDTGMTYIKDVARAVVPNKAWSLLQKGRQKVKNVADEFRASKRREMRSARSALLRSPVLSEAEKQLLGRVSLRLAPDDTMYARGQSRHYLGVGLSAMRCIDSAVRHTQTKVGSILDLPCGHGRVLRFLRAGFGKAEITACEIDPNAVRFCAHTFGAVGAQSTSELSKLIFPHQFDLIWCGSLVTHLDQQHTKDLLHCFSRHLAPGGLCLFTTHGEIAREWLETGAESYGLSPGERDKALAGFAGSGYGYADYNDDYGIDYGFSLVSFDRMTKIASDIDDWSFVAFLERGWDDHQDVYGFFKTQNGRTPPKPLIASPTSTKHNMAAPIF